MRLLHACTALGWWVNFLSRDSPTRPPQSAVGLNPKANPGQPPGRSERHTCIRIAPYDRVHAERAVRYRPPSCVTVPGGGINVSLSQGKHSLLHQSDLRSRVMATITRTSRRPVPCRSVRSAGFRHLRSRQAAGPSRSCYWPGSLLDHHLPVTETSIRPSRVEQGSITRCTGQCTRSATGHCGA
jgi:hypothetical protein